MVGEGEGRGHKGDRVTAGEVISEIETDKTTCEITAPVSGTIMEVFFTQGSLVPVFTTLCIIGAAERGKNRGGSGGESGIALKRLALVDQNTGATAVVVYSTQIHEVRTVLVRKRGL
jgi:pyruvate/2-oxoglutarate dehydrogenase complex dihydrolipoamide acyltransferase (E2) component